MGLDVLLENQLGHFAKVPHYSLSTLGVKIELIFTLQEMVSEIRANFQSCTYPLFLSHGGEIELIFTLRAAFCELWADF